jgi:hypothetical protein
LQIVAVADGARTFLLMTSAPRADFNRMSTGFDLIEQGFTLITGSRAAPDLPPPPAGARTQPNPPPPVAKPAGQAAPASGGNFYRMKRVRIVDEHGFERPMTALTLLLPTDWQFQGAAQYAQSIGCHANLVRLVFRGSSPDGKLAIEMLPGNAWEWADDLNTVRMIQMSNQQMAQFGRRACDLMPPMTAEDYLRRSVLPGLRRDARLIGMEPMPDIAQQVDEEAHQLQQTAARQGMQVRIRAGVARARLSYSREGQAAEEWLTAMTFSGAVAGPAFNMATGGVAQTYFYTCGGDHIFALRAPQGQLDAQEKFFRMVLSTIRVDPQWQARVTQAIAGLHATDSKGAADRSAIIAQNGRDISKIIHDTYDNSTKAHDRAMEGWSQYMRGVQTYRNPNTGDTVELSNQYGHAWAGPNNEYIVTDSANFDPNVTLRGNWTRLEAAR